MFVIVPDESDRLNRETTWLNIFLFKSLRISVGILFGSTVLWLFREEMMLKPSLKAVGEIKNESLFLGGRKSKNCFLLSLIEDWISCGIVEKHL